MRAEDDEMSNALMNDMADALRSAGLGSMIHSDEVEPESESEPETPSEILVEGEDEPEKSTISDEELTVEEQVQSLIEEGEYKSRSNAPQEALVAFNKAIALDPSSDMAWFNRGVLLEAQQDARGARQAFQICLDLNPDHAPATANLAILLDRIGDDAGAAAMAVIPADAAAGGWRGAGRLPHVTAGRSLPNDATKVWIPPTHTAAV